MKPPSGLSLLLRSNFAIFPGVFVTSQSSRRRQVALGAPRAGSKREGTVFIVETNANTHKVSQVTKVHGDQSGEYFGAALGTVDINNDGFDDLIVGSPLFTHDKNSGNAGYEEGRVSIYYREDHIFPP